MIADSTRARRRADMLATVLLVLPATAWPGPPMVGEDPGILEPGQWEIIAAMNGESRPSAESAQLPLLDVAYGLTPNTQISVVVPRQHVERQGESHSTGWGNGQIGYKWRFFSNGTVELAFAPLYSHPLDHGSTIRGLVEDVSVLNVPVVASLAVGEWTWNFQVGYAITSTSTNLWDYAVTLGHPLGRSAQLFLETWGAADDNLDNNALNYRVGLDFAFSGRTHLLAAIGGPITSDLPSDEKLDWDFYLGLQWFR